MCNFACVYYRGLLPPFDRTLLSLLRHQQVAPVTTQHFIVGDFIVIDTGATNLLFDEKMTLKEDYDYTAQVLQPAIPVLK
jgi:hypothetical protein